MCHNSYTSTEKRHQNWVCVGTGWKGRGTGLAGDAELDLAELSLAELGLALALWLLLSLGRAFLGCDASLNVTAG